MNYQGLCHEQIEKVQEGDTIILEQYGILTVTSPILPPLTQGWLNPKEKKIIGRSFMVQTEQGENRLLLIDVEDKENLKFNVVTY